MHKRNCEAILKDFIDGCETERSHIVVRSKALKRTQRRDPLGPLFTRLVDINVDIIQFTLQRAIARS
jgi:hypothetical protein